MFQCKTYLNTCLVCIIMLVRLLVGVAMFLLWIGKRKKQYSLIFIATILI